MKKLFTSVVALLFYAGANAGVIYVSGSGDDGKSGASWGDAMKSIVAAMNKANSGDQIWVAAGIYETDQTINYKEGVSLYGGFSGNETSVDQRERANAAAEPWKFSHETIIRAVNGSATSLRLFDRVDKDAIWSAEALFDGIVVDGHKTSNGRVGYFKEKVTLQNCIFRNCSAASGGSITYFEDGGKVLYCLYENNATVASIDLRNNKVGENRDRIYVEGCLLQNNLYTPIKAQTSNTSDEEGDETILIKKTTIRNNSYEITGTTQNGDAGAICVHNSWNNRWSVIEDCVIEGNKIKAWGGAAVFVKGGSPVLINRCIVRNNEYRRSESTWRTTGGTMHDMGGGAIVANCLITNNGGDDNSVYATLGVYMNNTISHNEGPVTLENGPTMINNIIDQDVARTGTAEVYTYFNGVAAENELFTTADDNVVISDFGFKSPTSFIGLATDDTKKGELQQADWSLSESSMAKGKGNVDIIIDSFDETVYAKVSNDLAGNARPSSGEINLGAYQGDAGVSGIDDSKVEGQANVYVAGNKVVVMTSSTGTLEVYTISGICVQEALLETGENTFDIPAQGIYLVRVSDNTGMTVRKVIVK